MKGMTEAEITAVEENINDWAAEGVPGPWNGARALIHEARRLRAEREAVIHAVNLYGDEVLHDALDAIGFAPRDQ